MEYQWMEAMKLGLLCTVSLPLGAMTALVWTPKSRMLAVLLAFGGGALIAALTIDLVAKNMEHGFLPLALGFISGGILYVLLNLVVNSKGGFMRKPSTMLNHLKRKKTREYKNIIKKLSTVGLFNSLPADELQALLPFITTRTYPKGTTIIRQGDKGDSMFIIEQGEVDVIDEKGGNRKIATLRDNDVVGELALVTGDTRTSSVVANVDTKVLLILKEHFDHLIHLSPKVNDALLEIVNTRLDKLKQGGVISEEKSKEWSRQAAKTIDYNVIIPTEADIKKEVSEHGGAPLAIWIGNLLDVIPASLIIGSSILLHPISASLMAGLFLANYPEALSSSVGMREQNYSKGKIVWMWASLMLICGLGALLGNLFLVGVPHSSLIFLDGIAAGAMLVMISETMLPEAFHKGASVTGLSTLAGFLAAILCSVI